MAFDGLLAKASVKQTAAIVITDCLFAKVFSTASDRVRPSNSKFWESSQMSKKSFMRLLSSPSLIIASNFSAITVSRL